MKFKEYLVLLCFVSLSLIPPINFIIKNPPLEYWLWFVLIAGFFGVFIIFLKTDPLVKWIAVISFINCFFSVIPYLSFTAYINIIACCYFYVLCTKLMNWDLVFKALQSVLILNVFLIFMQYINHDPLLNFGVFHMEHYGILGQHMQMSSFIIIISALLLMVSKWYIVIPIILSFVCHSSWAFLCTGVGMVIYMASFNKKLAAVSLAIIFCVSLGWMIHAGKIHENLSKQSGRVTVWKRSLELTNQRPWFGWGAGTFKDIFPPISRLTCIPYRTAHNFLVQFAFEFGYPLTGCLLFALGWLMVTLIQARQWIMASGLSMMFLDSLVHFPDRMIQTVPLCILFFAYARFVLRRQSYGF